jgi:hypothetical protein
MKILKYAAKLSKMSGKEINFRLRQKSRTTFERYQWKVKGDKGFFIPINIKKFEMANRQFPSPEIKFFSLTNNPEKVKAIFNSVFAEKKSAFLLHAENLFNHRFHFLGIDVTLPNPIQWNVNPQTGIEYPQLYYTLMDSYNTNRYGDVKYVWELNRHQFSIELAKAYFLTNDEKYSEKIWDFLESWFAENNYKIGINYTSALEHSIRVFAWVWTYYFTKESAIWTKQRTELFVKNLLLQGLFIEENLSFYYSPYNHLIGELAALSLLGTVFSNLPKFQNWQNKYWDELEKQVELQFNSDGFTVEQASYYHHFTLGFYLMLAILRKQNGLPVSQFVWDRMERAIEFSMYLMRPDGKIPMIGDIDNARSIYFYFPEDQWNLRYFLAIGAVLFERADFKKVSQNHAEELLWLFGEKGLQNYKKLAAANPKYPSRAFRESGYYVIRNSWSDTSDYCCFDFGEIAHGVFKDETPSAAHGHADILSFELTLKGKPLIIDPGFHNYFGPLDWHQFFRSTQGHNTITVNGAGQAVHEGRIGWSNVSSSTLVHWVSCDEFDFVAGAIDRFAKIPYDIFHRRYIIFNRELYFLIIDEVNGLSSDQTFNIESFLHFAPGKLEYSSFKLIYNDQLVSVFSLPENSTIEIDNGGESPDKGWVAEGYGYRKPAPVLRIKNSQRLPVYFGMLFPTNLKENQIIRFDTENLDVNIECYHLIMDDHEEKVFINPYRKNYNIKSLITDALCTIQKKCGDLESEFYFLKVRSIKSSGDKSNTYLQKDEDVDVKIKIDSQESILELWN